jgi:hypothetical protein
VSPHIFVSYSHKNAELATKLTKDLEREGYDIWLDRTDIQTGSRWDDDIVRGLNTSQVFMILLSETSAASQNVKDEIGYAIDNNMHIIPLLIEPCEVPFRLKRVQYVDFTALRYKEGVKAVLEILRLALPDAKLRPKKKERKAMDPVALAATVTGLLAPFLAKMGESMMEEVSANLPEKIGKLWGTISNRFKGNPTASGAASDLVKNAEDPDNQEAFALQLKKALKEDADFANLLVDLLEEAQGSISNVGDGAVATRGSIAVGKIQVGGDVSGNIAIGNNNQITDRNKQKKQK